MKILLDECIDRRFAREFPDLDVSTVPQMGWAGIKNGELMTLAQASFDVFITVDRNLSYQQHLPKYDICLIVLRARSNRVSDLRPFARLIIDSLPTADAGNATVLSLDPNLI